MFLENNIVTQVFSKTPSLIKLIKLKKNNEIITTVLFYNKLFYV